jgi:hypothetical protein
VFGTLVGSAYRSGIDLSGAELSGEQADLAGESIGQAWGVAQTLPGGGEAMLAQAQTAFVDAFRMTNAVSLAVAALAAVLVWMTLRPSRMPAPAGVASPADASVGLDAVVLEDDPGVPGVPTLAPSSAFDAGTGHPVTVADADALDRQRVT